MQASLEDMPSPDNVHALFSDCFDFNEPSVEPDPREVILFYEYRGSQEATENAAA